MALLCPRISPQDDPESARKARPKLGEVQGGEEREEGRKVRARVQGSKGRSDRFGVDQRAPEVYDLTRTTPLHPSRTFELAWKPEGKGNELY